MAIMDFFNMPPKKATAVLGFIQKKHLIASKLALMMASLMLKVATLKQGLAS